MKKLLALLLALAMVFSLAACSGGSTGGSSASPSDLTGNTASTSGVKLSDLKVGMIHIGEPSDMGYTYNHDLGTKEMMKNLGLSEDQVINKYNVGEDDACATAINECIEAGCQIIFATSFGHGAYMLEAAKNNPDVQFCHATGEDAKSAGLSNFHNYFTAIYEARYVAGIVAGMKLGELGETKLGYVAAMECAEVISGFTAFYLGAKSVNADVTMDVIYTNTWKRSGP